MASEGPRFPGTTASLANAGSSENAEAWVSPGNIVSDNGSEASITAATFDTPDISQLLVASNFGFTVPDGSTILGIVVEVERRDGAIGAASDNRVQLAKGTTFASLVGSNKAATTTDWPTAAGVASYGTGTTDLWGTTWTPAEIRASSFAVMLSVQADAANTDVFVDFIRVTVHYTPPNVTGTGAPSIDEATLAASGTVANPVTGTGAPSIDEATLAASGVETITGTATVAADEAVLSAAGTETFTGTSALTVDEAALAGTGAQADNDVTGTGAIAADEATLAASGVETFTGTAAVSVDEASLAATGVEDFTGTGDLAVDEAVLDGLGGIVVPITATGAIVADEAALSAAGERGEPVISAAAVLAAKRRLRRRLWPRRGWAI